MKKIAIIVAGGSGKRMGTKTPKQFLLINNKPVIFITIEKFIGIADEIIVVLPQNQFENFNNLICQYDFNYPLKIVSGGKERFHSVQNGLSSIQPNGLACVVAVHDAVRPLISKTLILKTFEFAIENENCIAAVPSKDSIRHINTSGDSYSVPRNEYYLVQTPQVFHYTPLAKAYNQEFDNFTDDASVFETLGKKINLIEGEYFNIKITTPEDLIIAKALLEEQTK